MTTTRALGRDGILAPYTAPANGRCCSMNREEIPAGTRAYSDSDGFIVCAGCAGHCTSCTDPDCDHPRYAYASTEARARESLAAILATLHADRLDRLRAQCAAAGIAATSPDHLGDEGERLAREERWTER